MPLKKIPCFGRLGEKWLYDYLYRLHIRAPKIGHPIYGVIPRVLTPGIVCCTRLCWLWVSKISVLFVRLHTREAAAVLWKWLDNCCPPTANSHNLLCEWWGWDNEYKILTRGGSKCSGLQPMSYHRFGEAKYFKDIVRGIYNVTTENINQVWLGHDYCLTSLGIPLYMIWYTWTTTSGGALVISAPIDKPTNWLLVRKKFYPCVLPFWNPIPEAQRFKSH